MICSLCGAMAEDTHKFCPSCGALLEAGVSEETLPAQPDVQPNVQPAQAAAVETIPDLAPAAPSYTPPSAVAAPTETPPAFAPASIPAPPQKPVRQPVYTQKQLMPLSTGQAVAFTLICMIPLVGLICEFVWAFSANSNLNRRALSRAALIWTAVFLGLALLLSIVFLAFLALNPQFDLRLFLMNTFFA